MKQSKPIYTAEVSGTVWFDPEKGVVVKQIHHGKQTEQWMGKLDKSVLRSFPHWRLYVDDIRTIDVSAELISQEEADRLIAEAEKVGDDKENVVEPKEVTKEEGTSWTYFVKRTTSTNNRHINEEKSNTIRAYVHYGAGAKMAGGQIESVPQVVYVDANDRRFEEYISREPPFIPMLSEKLSMVDNLPEKAGEDANFPVPVQILLQNFELAPLMPQMEFKTGLSWTRTLYTHIGLSTIVFPVTIEHEVRSYKQHKGRKCAVIDYSITGEFISDDHPEMIPENKRAKLKSVYRMEGKGTAYFDTSEDVLVEKEQLVTWEVLGKQLGRMDDGSTGWVTSEDRKTTTQIKVLLHISHRASWGRIAAWVVAGASAIVLSLIWICVKKKKDS